MVTVPSKQNYFRAQTNFVAPHGWGYLKRGDRLPPDRGMTMETPELARLVAAGVLISAFPIDSDVSVATVVVVPSVPTFTPPPPQQVPNLEPLPVGFVADNEPVQPVIAPPAPAEVPIVVEVVATPEPAPATEPAEPTPSKRSRQS